MCPYVGVHSLDMWECVYMCDYGLCLCVYWCMSVCLCVWVGGLVGGPVGVGLCVCEGAYRFEICLPYV